MKVIITTQQNTEQVEVRHHQRKPKDDAERAERHRAVARRTQQRYYYKQRVERWTEALTYLLTQEGDIEDLAEAMARRYHIRKIRH